MAGFGAILFILFLLSTTVLIVDADVTNLVLKPIEQTYEKVEMISKRPMLVTNMDFLLSAGMASKASIIRAQ